MSRCRAYQRAFAEFGNNVRTTYDYDPLDRRLQTLTSGKAGGTLFQNLGYSYDDVGNVLGMTNTVAVSPANQFGGPVTFTYGYDDLYRLTSATGSFEYQPGKVDRFNLTQTYDGIHNIKTKSQVHEVVQPGTTNPAIPQRKTSYAWIYDYTGAQPHASSQIGQRSFLYDLNGNQAGWDHDQNGTNRRIAWDEENRVQTITDTGHTMTYKYNDAGERVIKQGPQGETVYVNQFFTIRNREAGTKHVFAGATRAVSKLMKQPQPDGTPTKNTNSAKSPVEKDLYFYHPDHLGSSAYITDTRGDLYEHLEYFPFGETWVEESSNTQRTPYLFTSKELDEETGLYYFGARYYDPRTSVWQSADPILGRYLDGSPNDGVFFARNLSLYSYSALNPMGFVDPDGRAWVDNGGSPIWVPDFIGSILSFFGVNVEDYLAKSTDTGVTIYGSGLWNDKKPYTANEHGYVDTRELAQHPDARFSVKPGNESHLGVSTARDMFNLLRDHKEANPAAGEFVLTEAGNAEGTKVKGHSTHNFGRSFDMRYQDARGQELRTDTASGNADREMMGSMLDIANDRYNFDQNYAGPGIPARAGTSIRNDHSDHFHIGRSIGRYRELQD